MLLPVLSLIQCIYIYMLFERCAHNITVSNIPELFVWFPFTTSIFNMFAEVSFIAFDSYCDQSVGSELFRWRLPVCSLDYQFDSFKPLTCGGIVSESDAHQVVTVFFGESLCATLTR